MATGDIVMEGRKTPRTLMPLAALKPTLPVTPHVGWASAHHPLRGEPRGRPLRGCSNSLPANRSLRRQDAEANSGEAAGPKGEGRDALSQPASPSEPPLLLPSLSASNEKRPAQ